MATGDIKNVVNLGNAVSTGSALVNLISGQNIGSSNASGAKIILTPIDNGQINVVKIGVPEGW